jgi:type IV secretory pathway TrbF-like protein
MILTRLLTLLALVGFALAAFVNVIVITTTDTDRKIPFLVIEGPGGAFVSNGVTTSTNINFTPELAKFDMRKFIFRTRSVSLEKDLVYKQRAQAYYQLSPSVKSELYNQLREFVKVLNDQKNTTTVDIVFDSFTELGPETWVAQWTELVSRGGVFSYQKQYSESFVFEKCPESEVCKEEVESNPGQWVIKEFHLSEVRSQF